MQANRRITSVENLTTVAQIQAELPIEPVVAKRVEMWTKTIEQILTGEDPRLLVILGPCSIHSRMGALQFAALAHKAHVKFLDKLFVVGRGFFAKPRTQITDPLKHWTGFINDPLLNASFEMDMGARQSREILLAMTAMGLPVATEFLEFFEAQLFDDLVSWGAIGARSSESQAMRQLASALGMSVGFKNGTGGSMDIAIDGILTANAAQTFPAPDKTGLRCKHNSTGNPFAHLVLRGSPGKPNFDAEHVAMAKAKLQEAGINTGLGIDFSHANSGKVPKMHASITENVARQIQGGERAIRMVMMESHLIGGRQDHWDRPPEKIIPTLSITDPCEPWRLTERNLEVLANALP